MAKTKAVRKRAAKRTATKQAASRSPKSMPKAGRDPQGGLTAKGREFFNEKEGSHLRPGVKGPADTPEKMVRKGSFLRRHFAHPRGPMKNDKGEPTRLALSAHAWGEPVPQTMADAKRLAAEGHELLEQYHQAREGRGSAAKKAVGRKKATGKTATKTSAAKKIASKKIAAKKAVAKTTPAKSRTQAKVGSKRSAPRRER